jgi:DNA-binding MarR family transcriptional regulator
MNARGPLDELSFHVSRVYFNYKLLLERTLRFQGLDGRVKSGMGNILFALFERDGVIVRDLAERTRLSYPTITVMLKEMRANGLVSLRRDREDRRSVRVRLTATGRRIEPRCRRALARLNRVLERGLTRREVAASRRMLGIMVANMRKDEEDGR